MASRRSRIKGIATIPQRRKNCTDDTPLKIENVEIEVKKLASTSKENETVQELTKTHVDGDQPKVNPNPMPNGTDIIDDPNIAETKKPSSESATGNKIIASSVDDHKEVINNIVLEKKPDIAPTRRRFIKPAVPLARALNRPGQISKLSTTEADIKTENESGTTQNIVKTENSSTSTTSVDAIVPVSTSFEKDNTASEAVRDSVLTEENPNSDIQNMNFDESKPLPPVALQRRKFMKPTVSLSRAINRRVNNDSKAPIEDGSLIKTPEEEMSEPPIYDSDSMSRSSVELPNSESTLNEVNLFIQNDKSNISLKTGNVPKKPVTLWSSNHLSDTEYPPPPPSPSKINRSRIKAIPRLGYRKASFSASESEDESRRNSHRIRNDSVCSTTSVVADSLSECMSPMRFKESAASYPKKIVRNEQTRKLAEARLEFRRKFGVKTPDRQRLTMMDLIFYNPVTNPIKKDEKPSETVTNDEEVLDDPAATENVDDPQDEEDKEDEDDDNAVPVPQIKIGPSGEIMLDEKSLVVERKDLKRQMEEIQKSKVVDGDGDASYGIYKRHKRGAKWTASETVRFYRALNTLGTDFELMVELFPNRTRRDLKLKFNREEKTNRMLIDKALMQPCQYAYDSLKLDLEREIRIQNERQKQIEEDIEIKKKRQEEKRKRNAMREEKNEPKPPKIKKRAKKPELSIKSLIDGSDADVSDTGTQSGSEDELILPYNSTRSGRIPKVTKKFEPEPLSVKKVRNKSKTEKIVKGDIEPGSIMIVNEVGPNNEPIYKLYMVTPDQSKTQIDLNSEDLSKVLQFRKGINAQNIMTISATVTDDEEAEVEPPPVENNMTIVEDANVTTLKSKPCITTEENSQPPEENTNPANLKDNQVIISENTIVEDDSVATKNYVCKIEDRPVENNVTIIEDSTATSSKSNCSLGKEDSSNDDIKQESDVKTEIKNDQQTSQKSVNVISDQIIVLGVEDSSNDSQNNIPDKQLPKCVKPGSKEESELTEEAMSDILKYIIDGKGVAFRIKEIEQTEETDKQTSSNT